MKTKIKTKVKIKKGDLVRVMAGKNKGKEGKVLVVDREKNRVIVENVNLIKKHQKPSRTHQKGGIIEKESPIHVSNVAYLHNGKPTKIGYKLEVTTKDGKEVTVKKRIAKSTGEVIN